MRSRPRDGSQREVRVHARRSRRHFFLSFSALCEFTPASARPSRRAVFQPRDTKDGYFRTPPRNTSEPFLVKHRVDDESTRSFAMCLGATFFTLLFRVVSTIGSSRETSGLTRFATLSSAQTLATRFARSHRRACVRPRRASRWAPRLIDLAYPRYSMLCDVYDARDENDPSHGSSASS